MNREMRISRLVRELKDVLAERPSPGDEHIRLTQRAAKLRSAILEIEAAADKEDD